jgi:lipid A oxidase
VSVASRVVACAFFASAPIEAKWFVAAYGGGSHSVDSDLTASQPDGTHFFRGVSWESRSFESPPYYGLQFGNYFAADGAFGLRLDFCHDKVYAQTTLAPTLQRFSLSHGLNSITLDALARRRWSVVSVYAGAGIGTIVPHVEAATSTRAMDEYQWFRGPAAKLFAGVTVDIAGPLAAFAELRLTWVHASVDIPQGDAHASFLTEHAAAGALLRL